MEFTDLFTTQGRANRAWYLWHIVLDDLVIVSLVIAMITLSVILSTPLLVIPLIGVILGGVWAAITITVKRLHDLGRPGWHWFLLGVPIYNIYLGLVLLFKRGSWGDNQFGPDPLSFEDRTRYLDSQPPMLP
jgi:uncharacterized membrane protein YhaH (DUF805 family)